MKDLSQVKDFYYKDIYSKVLDLELERLELVGKLQIMMGISAIIFLIMFILFYIYFIDDFFPDIILTIFAPFFLSIAIYAIGQYFLTKNYVSGFKNEVLKEIIQFIEPNLNFDKDRYISRNDFNTSNIFNQQYHKYNGNDLVYGTIDKTKFLFSDLHIEYKTKNGEDTNWHTLFQGIFFIADFNKEFIGNVVVLPDYMTPTFGLIANFFQNMKGNLIKLDNPEFEKKFVVYGDDQITARYILTHSMMDRILKLKEKVGKRVDIHLSFMGDKIYIAIDYREDQFEPNPFKSLKDFTPIENYVQTLRLIINLVEDFKLNDRLWSKD